MLWDMGVYDLNFIFPFGPVHWNILILITVRLVTPVSPSSFSTDARLVSL